MQSLKKAMTIFLGALLTLMLLSAAYAQSQPEELAKNADKLFEEKNYKDAAEVYKKIVQSQSRDALWHDAYKRAVLCNLRLELFDDALTLAENYVKDCAGSPHEARANRFAGNLCMMLPHWGTRAGGKFIRARWEQGIHLQTHRHDKQKSAEYMERARELYEKYESDAAALATLPEEEAKKWREERIEQLFDLVNIYARFGIYENDSYFWHFSWGERDDKTAETAGEEDFDEYRNQWQLQRKRPLGLRLDPDGKPLFPKLPEQYTPSLDDDEKILFLLMEIRELDPTKERKLAAQSIYRQAMLARARFGLDRLNQFATSYWEGGRYPMQEEVKNFNPWEMKDAEALILAGGRLMIASLPPEWDVMALLRKVAGEMPESGHADEAQYALGIYYQSRQQYKEALEEYELLKKNFSSSPWAERANEQIGRIKEPQVAIRPTGVHLKGNPVKVQIDYRNTTKIWFVARRINLEGFLEEIRNENIDPEKGMKHFWSLGYWSQYFTSKNEHEPVFKIAAKFIAEETARWSAEVKDDGTYRYAEATVDAPLAENGVYLVYACLNEPPAGDAQISGDEVFALGVSRAVMAVSDLAFVEKKTKSGNLYYICDARTGAPVYGASISILEVWNQWNETWKKSEYFKKIHNIKTDKDGMALFDVLRERNSSLHLLIRAQGGRMAWSGMTYKSHYYASIMQDQMYAYGVTDRPVYRPGQTVKFKFWLRQRREGLYQNLPGQQAEVIITDPKGNNIYTAVKTADQFGGVDGEFTLGEEPPLGLYNLVVSGIYSGVNFRVEEYKKPEFEVTVEPGKSHARLGEKITALIKAKYYFGAPVTDAKVKYKIFREEYSHSYYFPSRWDWLYGPGYGLPWYEYRWFPWWGRILCCWSPPWWWWGWRGITSPNPVRELVQEGEKAIGANGSLSLEIDTAPALRDHPDRDHRYVIQAEVTDASRRVITGEGAVKVTRQAFYAFLQSDRGYYRPGEEVVINLRCLTPDDKPMKAEGLLTISSIIFGGTDNARIEEQEIERRKIETDDNGSASIRMRPEKSGQIKFKFETPDSWGGVVEGYALVWVCGKDFDGQKFQFNELEIITDKRTYQPGETAHLMINTMRPNSYILFSDEVDNNHLLSWRLIHVPQKHIIIDVPIKETHRPNFFVEATVVSDALVSQQAAGICVPPEKSVLDIIVKADKEEYLPGEKATIHVSAKTPDGKPARAQFALSVFDKSVTYIQSEFAAPIAKFFYGQTRHHFPSMITNLTERFQAFSRMVHPWQILSPLPPDWQGLWGLRIADWRGLSDAELGGLSGSSAYLPSSRKAFSVSAGDVWRVKQVGALEMAAPMAAGAMMMKDVAVDRALAASSTESSPDAAAPAFAEAAVREAFADTAFWLPTLATDENGSATISFKMPENLTTWKINVWGASPETQVGEATSSAVTTKNLLVRLQAPRFFLEYDEVVISANVHNYLSKEKQARVSLDVPADLLKMIGETPQQTDVAVPAGGEARVDWRVKVLKEGAAAITVKALTDEESDAMRMNFPVLVHGITKQIASTGSMRPDDIKKTVSIELDIPELRKPELTTLEVRYAPTLALAMMDALPYCIEYPYGCTEQTMSRFLPCVLTLKTLQNMGVTLDEVKKIRGRMDEVRRINKGERICYYSDSPIFDETELKKMIAKSLDRITSMQHASGGWGWWRDDDSSPYLTSYVAYALCAAQSCDVKVDEQMIMRAIEYLKNWEVAEMQREPWSPSSTHAFVAYVLSLKGAQAEYKPPKKDARSGKLIERLFEGRDKLELYGKALLSMALANVKDEERARLVLQNIMQYKEENTETQVAWFRTPRAGWWFWWNSNIETNAMILRAIVRLEPKSDIAPRLVKWLLNNRRNGYYWDSTRDTTLCIAAMSDFAAASGETSPDFTLTLDYDNGAVVKKVKINRENLLTFDNLFRMEGESLGGGKHTLKITKEGAGALYFNTYLKYFTKEERITAAGHELKVARLYHKLQQIPYEVEVDGSQGQKIMEKRLRYERIPLNDGDTLQSGDQIQVELKVTSDNDYTFLCFEDMKPAGCEATEVRSGGKGQEGFFSYMELRDEKVVFFVDSIGRGEHLLRYRLRAEIPGVFHALPAILYGMYAPDLRANSDEMVIKIVD